LIIIKTGGAEREVEIGDDGIQRQIARDRPGDVMGDGGCADAALCATIAMIRRRLLLPAPRTGRKSSAPRRGR